MYRIKGCGYQCKKVVTLSKHINTKHTKKKRMVFDEECETLIDMLKQVSENIIIVNMKKKNQRKRKERRQGNKRR